MFISVTHSVQYQLSNIGGNHRHIDWKRYNLPKYATHYTSHVYLSIKRFQDHITE